MPEHEAEAELRRLLLRALQGAEARELEVVAALGAEVSALRLQPRFARCCKARRPVGSH